MAGLDRIESTFGPGSCWTGNFMIFLKAGKKIDGLRMYYSCRCSDQTKRGLAMDMIAS